MRELLRACCAEGVLRNVDVARRVGVNKSSVSRFQNGVLDFSAQKLAAIHVLLDDVRAARVVLRVKKPKARPPKEIAGAMLEALPPALLARGRDVLALDAEGSKIARVQRALVLHATQRCDGNLTAAGELLRSGRKRLSRAWAAFQTASVEDPRTVGEKVRREHGAAALLRDVPDVVLRFGEALIALSAQHGSRLELAHNVLLALALRDRNGDAASAAKLLGERRTWVDYRAQRMATRAPTPIPAPASARPAALAPREPVRLVTIRCAIA